MITSRKIIFLSFLFFLHHKPSLNAYNLNLIGFVNNKGSGACHTSSFIECLHDEVSIKLYKTDQCFVQNFPPYFSEIVENGVDLIKGPSPQFWFNRANLTLKGITVYTDLWDDPIGWAKYMLLPNQSSIKFAYCVTESTIVPTQWVTRLNNNFDAIIVPDEWLVNVYKSSGVNLPIFVLPEVLNLNSLLKNPVKNTANKPFTFGFSGAFWPRKNHDLLIKAFAQEFGNNPDVTLKIHSKFPAQESCNALKTFRALQAPNISILQKNLARNEYETFITSLDCYVTISKGEGFSIIPREALAAGIPCIVSDNTAQTTICRSGCVCAVPSNIIEPFRSTYAVKNNVGYNYNCTIEDVKKALREVYQNYQHHLMLAEQGREWVKQYLAQNLKEKYITLIKPKTIILGDHNSISEECLVTNSSALFQKYKRVCKPEHTVIREVILKQVQDDKN